jgi:protocatechuate 3,4-dioxygenase beta subunit
LYWAKNTYSFTQLAPGSYVLCAIAQLTTTLGNHYVNECYEDQEALLATPILMAAGETRTVDLMVGDMSLLSTVRGTVRNSNGQPLAGMSVFGYSSIFGYGIVQTDGAGVYTMPLVAPGFLQLMASDPQGLYQGKPNPDSGSYGDGTSLEVAPSVTITANFTLRPAGLIRGQVFVDGDPTYTCFVDAVRIEPLGYPPVYVTGSSLCDESGRYTVTGLAAGSYRVSASVAVADMYLTGNHGGADVQPVTVIEGQTRSGVDIRLGAGLFGGEISGRVTSAGRPVAAVQVELFTQSGSFLNRQMTDAQGRYQFRGLVIPQNSDGRLPPYFLHVVDPLARYAQSCYVNIYSSFYAAADCPITTPAGITATTDITLPAGAALAGQVVDQAGQGEAGVSVRLYYARPVGLSDGYPWRDYWALSSTTSDANGFYRFGGLRAGRYVVGAVAPAAPPVYYFYGPAAKIELAPLITLSTGQQRAGLTLVLAKMLELFLPVTAR